MMANNRIIILYRCSIPQREMPIPFTFIILNYLESLSIHFPSTHVVPFTLKSRGERLSKDDSVITTSKLVFSKENVSASCVIKMNQTSHISSGITLDGGPDIGFALPIQVGNFSKLSPSRENN